MSENWLKCDVTTEGMFSDELVVAIAGRSFFVPRDQVEGKVGSSGKLRVRVVPQEPCANNRLVILPTEDVAIVEVNNKELEMIGG